MDRDLPAGVRRPAARPAGLARSSSRLGSVLVLAIGLAFLVKWAIDRGTGSLYAGAIITALAAPGLLNAAGDRGRWARHVQPRGRVPVHRRRPSSVGRRLGLAALVRRPAGVDRRGEHRQPGRGRPDRADRARGDWARPCCFGTSAAASVPGERPGRTGPVAARTRADASGRAEPSGRAGGVVLGAIQCGRWSRPGGPHPGWLAALPVRPEGVPGGGRDPGPDRHPPVAPRPGPGRRGVGSHRRPDGRLPGPVGGGPRTPTATPIGGTAGRAAGAHADGARAPGGHRGILRDRGGVGVRDRVVSVAAC